MTTATTKTVNLREELAQLMHETKTARQLYTLVTSAEFKSKVATLSPDDTLWLRDMYQADLETVRGKVKLDEIAGEIVTVDSIRDGNSQYGTFIVIAGTRENGQRFETITSSSPLQRFFGNTDTLKSLPIMVIFTKSDFTGEDGRKMQKWNINRVNQKGSYNSELPW